MPESAVLRVVGLCAEFRTTGGSVKAVRGVSLEVGRGEKVAIVGESGSGKSTLALAMLGLVPEPGRVTDGDLVLAGRDLRQLSPREWSNVRGKEISLVYQDSLSALDPIRTIGRQLIDTLRIHRRDLTRRSVRAAATDLLKEVGIPRAESRLGDFPHEFSGGMRQRVAIAMAIAANPQVIVADEPTTALDVTTQAQILALLDRLVQDRGTSVVLVTHDLGVVARFCDSVNVMYAGQIVESGRVEAVLTAPSHPYTRALLASAPRGRRSPEFRFPVIPGHPVNLSQLGIGCAFRPRCEVGLDRRDCAEHQPALRRRAVFGSEVGVACHWDQEVRDEKDTP